MLFIMIPVHLTYRKTTRNEIQIKNTADNAPEKRVNLETMVDGWCLNVCFDVYIINYIIKTHKIREHQVKIFSHEFENKIITEYRKIELFNLKMITSFEINFIVKKTNLIKDGHQNLLTTKYSK